jgi:8-oxo-dGTP pyrophosphatase MutT (NUDIX family)
MTPAPADPANGVDPVGLGNEEQLTAVDVTGTPAGRFGRRAVHEQGLWHDVFHCLVVRSDPPARVLLQRRRLGARSFPGLLDLTATGHLAAGETALEGIRELREEVGIEVAPERLVPLGVRLVADDSGEGGRNRERAHVFLLSDDRPLPAFPLDPAEVAGLVELTADDLLAILASSEVVVPCVEIGADPGAMPVATRCRAADLVPPMDGYWTVLAVMAQRYVAGLGPIAI